MIVGMLMAIFFYDKLDKILALCGTILGTTVVLFIPAICHYKIAKNTPYQDAFIAVYAATVLVVCSSIIFS